MQLASVVQVKESAPKLPHIILNAIACSAHSLLRGPVAASGQSEAPSEGALTMQSAPETGTQAPLRDLGVSSSDERVEFHPIDMSDETVSAVPAGPEGANSSSYTEKSNHTCTFQCS